MRRHVAIGMVIGIAITGCFLGFEIKQDTTQDGRFVLNDNHGSVGYETNYMSILDSQTGTLNVWNKTNDTVKVYEFQTVAVR